MKDAEFVLLMGAIASGMMYLAVIRRRAHDHGMHMLIWRWFTGHHWSGELITDAGWKRPGTKAFNKTGHASRWHYRPRRYRAAWRTSGTLATVWLLWGALYARTATLVALGATSAVALLGGVLMGVSWWRGRVHRRQWVEPVHLVAAPLVGLPLAHDPAEWLTISRDRTRVVIMLPSPWRGESAERARLVEVVSARLALDSPEVMWAMTGPRPRVELTQSVPPPSRVVLADVAEQLARAKDDELVWGLGRKGTVVKTSLSGDSPHVGLSMGSGAGKSVTARSLLAQMLAKGAIGLVLDFKMISHQWAASLPNVYIARRPAEIHEALIWLGLEVERRNEVALAGADENGDVLADVGPRIIVVAEELNATVAQLRSYWQGIRGKDDPKRPPSLTALDMASFTGRQVKVNIVYIGQRLSDKATGGGGDARENIGVIAFGRWRASTWKMLAPDFPMPAKNLTPGRLQVVSDVVREAQGILMTPAEARALALSGTVSPLPSSMPGVRNLPAESCPAGGEIPHPDSAPVVATTQIQVSRRGLHLVVDEAAPELPPVAAATLREAVGSGVLPLSLAAARKRAERDPAFPRPVGRKGTADTYALDDLAAYATASLS